jgi:hypothetical protein
MTYESRAEAVNESTGRSSTEGRVGPVFLHVSGGAYGHHADPAKRKSEGVIVTRLDSNTMDAKVGI